MVEINKATIAKMLIVHAFEPEKIVHRGRLRATLDLELSGYAGRRLGNEAIWQSIKELRKVLSAGKSDRHKALLVHVQSVAPSSLASTMLEAGIIFQNSSKKIKPLSERVAQYIGVGVVAAIAVVLALGAFAIFGKKTDDGDVVRYKACKDSGDMGDRWDCEEALKRAGVN
jgi:hypothetical protein